MNLIRFIISVALLTTGALAHAAVATALRPNPVLPGEIFELQITQSPAGSGEPALLPLPEGVRELQRQSSQSTQIINGSRRTSRSWTLSLIANKPGEYPIRFAPLDGENVAPVRVQVVRPDPQSQQQPEVFAHFNASTTQPWQGAEVILNLHVYIAGDLDSGSLPDPVAPGLVIEKLSESNDGEELIGNQRYRVLHRRYVAFPERAGRFVIPGPVFSGQLVDRSRPSRFPSFSVPTRRISTIADDIVLNVQAAQSRSDAVWIPATDVQLRDTIDLPGGRAERGQAMTRTVTLEIRGQLHTQVPELNWPLPARAQAQSFAEEPQQSTQTRGEGVVAIVVQNFVHIPQGDQLELPAVRLPWFNTREGRWEEAVLPGRQIAVQAPPPGTADPVPTPGAESAERAPDERAETLTDTVIEPAALRWWRALALGSTAGWIITLIGWGWLARKAPKAAAPPEIAEARRSPRRDTQAVIQAAQQNDAAATAQAVRRWARSAELLSRDSDGRDLNSLAAVFEGQDLASQLTALSNAIYGQGAWSGSEFIAAFQAAKPPRSRSKKTPQHLARLYPDDA